ncbi:hypothetical protein DT019_08680 [Streptomyces sp. SDr-06]|uniref:hypothetical protein n=1 Tax=Streptomyces sp. SDr-06 TaxID=2267702 RepID=UPI000DEA8FA8|nr:hypothetical protein [Streptomyces sp. SDr-06]RCH68739.1 hypothetical protein DT019_08680 [Streptomyces sp. SDr-06]
MRYTLTNGYSVHVAELAHGMTEFEMLNAEGETTSVVNLHGVEAADLKISLRVLQCLRGR